MGVVKIMVGVAGFEPTISRPPVWRLIRARPHPDERDSLFLDGLNQADNLPRFTLNLAGQFERFTVGSRPANAM